MDEWLEDLDKCEDMGWYFEIESEESGRLADDIRKVLARIEQLEAALREISHIHDGNPSPAMAGMPDVDYARFILGEARRVARAALGEKKDG